jgi:hypothetical protein
VPLSASLARQDFLIALLLDLLDSLPQEFLSVPHHVYFSAGLKVGLR